MASQRGDLPPMDFKKTRASKKMRSVIIRAVLNLFSDDKSRRDPPLAHTTRHIRLITVAVSHFCEKARWGLDLLESDEYGENPFYYTEDGHAPPFCSFSTLEASNNEASATPMIVVDGDERDFLYKSDVILRDLCPFLYPDEFREEIVAFEDDMGLRLGSTSRCVAYWSCLDPDRGDRFFPAFLDMCSPAENTSKIERFLTEQVLGKGLEKVMRRVIHLSAETSARSAEELRVVFSEVSQRLEKNGSGYLFGDEFTAADLTFASLAYFIIHPKEMDNFLLEDSRLPPDLLDLSKELRATKAGRYVVDMYAKHRPVGESGAVVLKSAKRNRLPIFEAFAVVGSAVALASAIYVAVKST